MSRTGNKMKSRFSHFDTVGFHDVNGRNGYSEIGHISDASGGMIISAGIGFRSRDTGQGDDFTGSFVTTVLTRNEMSREAMTTVIKPDDINDGKKVITYPNKPEQDTIGSVTITPVEKNIQNGTRLSNSRNVRQAPQHFKSNNVEFHLPNPIPQEQFEIYVENHDIPKTYKFHVKQSDRVDHLNCLIYDRLRILHGNQILQFNGKQLDKNATLGYYGITKNSTISLVGLNQRSG